MLTSLKVAIDMNIKNLEVCEDSILIISQTIGGGQEHGIDQIQEMFDPIK